MTTTQTDDKVCTWTGEEEGYSLYRTGCGRSFTPLDDSDPVDEWANFCPYCGRHLSVKNTESDEGVLDGAFEEDLI